nr:fasciclin domain-containing protein [Mycobacterium sp. RTGN5]
MVAIQIRTVAAIGCVAVAVAGMSGCSSSGKSGSSSSAAPAMTGPAMTGPAMTGPAMTGPAMTGPAAADPAAALVGSGCGSVSGMAQVPVVTAASNNPDLTTLTAALSGKLNPGVNLVDTLNGGEFTVIAPTDDAFKKLGPATLDRLKSDVPLLTSILTYHVIPGQLSPPLVAGTHKSVEGADVTVTGAGETLKFNGSGLVCGGIQTANATVYIVDTVLMPPAK